jgi:hypothetical protein
MAIPYMGTKQGDIALSPPSDEGLKMKRIHSVASVLVPAFLLLILPAAGSAQGSGSSGPSGPGLRLTIHGNGLAIGDVPRVNGLRINLRDRHLERVNGVNLTFFNTVDLILVEPGDRSEHPGAGGTVNGLSIGLLGPEADRLNGVNIGGAAVLARERLWGINLGGLAAVSQGEVIGLNYGTLAVIGEQGVRGISLGGMVVIAPSARISGAYLSTLAVVADQGLSGFGVTGLAMIAEHGPIRGVHIGGLAVFGESSVTGLSVGGIDVISDGPIRWLQAGGLAVASETSISGLTLSGFRVHAPRVEGVAGSLLWLDTTDFTGIGIAGYNGIRGTQKGITIGLLNRAAILKGLQIGLLNIAGNNQFPFRILPVLNLNLKG